MKHRTRAERQFLKSTKMPLVERIGVSTDEVSNSYVSEINARHNENTGRKKSKEWNDSVAKNFSSELERLRNLRLEEGLDGVDRGALK